MGEFNYERECTPEEAAVLDADRAAAKAEEFEDEVRLRDSWFALLRNECVAQPLD